jgi:hypothetical protein
MLNDTLSILLPSNGPGITDVGVCFGCCGNMFTGHCLGMDAFSESAILAFSCHVTLYSCRNKVMQPICNM